MKGRVLDMVIETILFSVIIAVMLIIVAYLGEKSNEYKYMREDKAYQKKISYSYIGKMKESEFDELLCWVLALCVEHAAVIYEHPQDPHATDEIQQKTLVMFVEYFSGCYDAIESMYGKDYLIQWYNLRFSLLVINGLYEKLVAHDITHEAVYFSLIRPMMPLK